MLMTLPAACVPSAQSPGEMSIATRTASDESNSGLAGTEWILASLAGHEIPESAEISLKIENDPPYTRFRGDAVCNSYGGRNVATEDGIVEINAVERTAVGCGARNSVESAYFDALTNAATYRVEDGSLELRDRDGETILIYDRREDTLPKSGGRHED